MESGVAEIEETKRDISFLIPGDGIRTEIGQNGSGNRHRCAVCLDPAGKGSIEIAVYKTLEDSREFFVGRYRVDPKCFEENLREYYPNFEYNA